MSDRKERFTFSRCSHCAAVYLHPRISARNLSTYYPDWYLPYRGASAWGKFADFVERSQAKVDRKRVQTCTRLFPKREKRRLLDVGCGKPDFLLSATEQTSWDVAGIDFSADGWQDERYDRLNLTVTDLHNAHFEEGFDVITMWHYLEHDYDPPKTLKKVASLLKPGGKLIAEVPDPYSLTRKWQGEFWEGWHAPRHTVLYSHASFEALAKASGLHLRTHKHYGTLDAFTLWWMGGMEKKGIDWKASMEPEFWPLVWRKIYSAPVFALERFIPLGVQTVIFEKAE